MRWEQAGPEASAGQTARKGSGRGRQSGRQRATAAGRQRAHQVRSRKALVHRSSARVLGGKVDALITVDARNLQAVRHMRVSASRAGLERAQAQALAQAQAQAQAQAHA